MYLFEDNIKKIKEIIKMITDTNKNFYSYANVHPRFETAFRFFEKLMAEGAENGKHILEGTPIENEIYVNIMTCELSKKDAPVAESHDKYIDIQVLLEGDEVMYVPTSDLYVTENKPEKDCKLYAPANLAECHKINVTEGSFAVFFTGELHAPCATESDAPASVRKAVIKVLA